jgi:hypothetical protein
MWQQVSAFLFDNNAIAGLQFENWMWVVGVPALLACWYFFERGFGPGTNDAQEMLPGDGVRLSTDTEKKAPSDRRG